jgi:tyrosyl-tRNA synthetase
MIFFIYNNCKLQMGGSDQWGNITTGTELIRRKTGGTAFALTCPLITKSDGGKFGKTEKGNVWLSPEYTSPYQFYQFWLNVSDQDAEKYIKIFTFLLHHEIELLVEKHKTEPQLRNLQRVLAREITIMVHSEEEYNAAVEASEILFGKGTAGSLAKLKESDFLSIFEGVPQYEVNRPELSKKPSVIELFTMITDIFSSKSELRRLIDGGGLSVNKQKISNPEETLGIENLLNNKYMLVQKGKKSYNLIIVK